MPDPKLTVQPDRWRFDWRGNVVPDRRRYFDWADKYETGFPLRPVRKSSPARVEYKAARSARRALLAA